MDTRCVLENPEAFLRGSDPTDLDISDLENDEGEPGEV